MSGVRNLVLPFGDPSSVSESGGAEAPALRRDRAARAHAVDPRRNVVLEASAGTGKTRVLVDRYVNLMRAGVDPANVLAITFTRKAAAEMRERIVATLRDAGARGEMPPSRWHVLRERLGEIAVSTMDAFCLALLREFPLEADVDPGFDMADETEVPLLVREALDRALRTCRTIARDDHDVALVFARLGEPRARSGLAGLLERRMVAPAALARYLAGAPRDLTLDVVVRRGAASIRSFVESMPGGLVAFLEAGPPDAVFLVLGRTIGRLLEAADGEASPPLVHATFMRLREYFLTQDGKPRVRPPYARAAFASPADWRAHTERVSAFAPVLAGAHAAYRRDLTVLVARGLLRMYRIAEREYRHTLEAHAVLDFTEVLARTIDLLRHMEEFAQSRYRLESRYHHVLVDEFQDTSRAQWELVSLLVRSWGEGAGLAQTGPLPPSIFIVGDRKQSIYRFRDADVSVLQDARTAIERLRPEGDVRRSISRSFRSVPALLAFVNDVGAEMAAAAPAEADGGSPPGPAPRADAFRYEEDDRFPLAPAGRQPGDAPLGLVAADSVADCAAAVAGEIARLIGAGATIRDRATGLPRAAGAGDIAVLFRTRESHREFEAALERRGIASYVYKGLGFFDADEVRDVLALVAYLANPASNRCAAAWLRSRFVRLSDEGLRRLAPHLAEALLNDVPPPAAARLDARDAHVLSLARAASGRWRALADRMPPAELIDSIIADAAYLIETRGPRAQQARENLKKLRGLVRRMQNRGYLSIARLAVRLERLAVGEEANAVIDASGAVHLMTIHAAKGLEFPVVFLVNLTRGSGGARPPIRVTASADDDVSVSVGEPDEGEEDETAADREETKRLLYVALTRARDRLYLGAVRRDGRIQPARGSLAEVLPPALLALFDAAGGSAPERGWQARSGTSHTFVACAIPPREADPAPVPAAPGGEPADAPWLDYETIELSRPQRTASALPGPGLAGQPRTAAATTLVTPPEDRGDRPPSDRLTGTLVHRLVHRTGFETGVADDILRRRLAMLVRPGELSEVADAAGCLDRAVALFRRLAGQPEVRAFYEGAEVLHEVPFTMATAEGLVRGMIDCVLRRPDRIVVLELKTGAARPEHELQAELYGQAVRALFPDVEVEVRLVHVA